MTVELIKQVDQEAITGWGALSGDRNPLHVDPAYASGTRYGRTILHGHLTVAWLCEWALREWGPPWLARGIVEGLRFRRPLHADEKYRIRGELHATGAAADVAIVAPDGEVRVTATMRLRDPEDGAS